MGFLSKLGMLAVVGGVLLAVFPPPDVLNGLSSNHDHGPLEVQAIMTAFCLSPVISQLLGDRDGIDTTGGDFKFEDDGDIENDEYAQASIYAILYAMYKNTPNLISPHGIKYRKFVQAAVFFCFANWHKCDISAPRAANEVGPFESR